MQFEWDPKKAKSNLKKPRVSFEAAVTVFCDPLAATFDDPDHTGDEWRFMTIGFSSRNRLLVVLHSEKGEALAIISTRPATAHERKPHEG